VQDKGGSEVLGRILACEMCNDLCIAWWKVECVEPAHNSCILAAYSAVDSVYRCLMRLCRRSSNCIYTCNTNEYRFAVLYVMG